MSAMKITEAAHLTCLKLTRRFDRRLDRRCDDAFEAAAHLGFESGGHGMRRLSDGDHEDAIVGIKMVQIFADAQHTPLAVHVAREGVFDGCVLQRRRENLAGNFAHASELLAALGR